MGFPYINGYVIVSFKTPYYSFNHGSFIAATGLETYVKWQILVYVSAELLCA